MFDYGTHRATIDFNAHEANPWIDTWSFEAYGTTAVSALLEPEWSERYQAGSGPAEVRPG